MAKKSNIAVKPKAAADPFGLRPEAMSPAERKNAVSGFDLRYRIEALVAGITAKKIKHRYAGSGAATMPGFMILPSIPSAHLFPARHVLVLLGYAAHEICHQLLTDFSLVETIFADMEKPTRRELHVKEFWNAIEDYRIERFVRARYPGFPSMIEHTRDFSAQRFVDNVQAGLVPAKDLSNPYAIGAVGLTWIGAALNGYRTKAPAKALEQLNPMLHMWLEGWSDDMEAVHSCQDALDLAHKIMDELDQMSKGDPDDGEGGDGDGSEGEDQQGNPNGRGRPSSSNSSKSKSRGSPQPGDSGPSDAGQREPADDESGSCDQGGLDPEDPAGDRNSSSPDTRTQSTHEHSSAAENEGQDSAEANDNDAGRPQLDLSSDQADADAYQADLQIDDLAKAITKLPGSRLNLAQEVAEDDLLESVRAKAPAPGGAAGPATRAHIVDQGQKEYAAIRQNVSSAGARTAGIIRRMLQSRSRTHTRGEREEGVLDMDRLVPILRGDPNVYRQTRTSSGINTALSLLLDNSGSMQGAALRVCQETSVVLDMSVTGTPTAVEINGFTGLNNETVIYRYRQFSQKGQAASATLGNMRKVQLGGTPVAVALMDTWRRLEARNEPRKIIIVVSDGQADDARISREMHNYIVNRGGIVLGIVIGSASWMTPWCDRVREIADFNDLPQALASLIQEIM